MKNNNAIRISIITSMFIAQFVAFSALAGDETPNTETNGAYGVVLRKQSSGNRVMIQPLDGLFTVDADIQYIDRKGEYICSGKVQKVYSNLIYSVAEGCEKFDEIKTNAGVTYNRDGRKMLEVYDTKDKIDTVVRENEWKRSSGIPFEINEDQHENMVLKSKTPVFLEIYATWCPRCTEFSPILGEVAKDLEGKVRVAKIDGEKARELEKSLKLKGYPSLYLYLNGIIVEQWSGAYEDKKPVLSRINNKLTPLDKNNK
jgi:thioredoxin 1